MRTGDFRKPMRLGADQERKLFSRLARAGMIARVWRGLCLVPPRLPLPRLMSGESAVYGLPCISG